jgi:hypothetical protein
MDIAMFHSGVFVNEVLSARCHDVELGQRAKHKHDNGHPNHGMYGRLIRLFTS